MNDLKIIQLTADALCIALCAVASDRKELEEFYERASDLRRELGAVLEQDYLTAAGCFLYGDLYDRTEEHITLDEAFDEEARRAPGRPPFSIDSQRPSGEITATSSGQSQEESQGNETLDKSDRTTKP